MLRAVFTLILAYISLAVTPRGLTLLGSNRVFMAVALAVLGALQLYRVVSMWQASKKRRSLEGYSETAARHLTEETESALIRSPAKRERKHRQSEGDHRRARREVHGSGGERRVRSCLGQQQAAKGDK